MSKVLQSLVDEYLKLSEEKKHIEKRLSEIKIKLKNSSKKNLVITNSHIVEFASINSKRIDPSSVKEYFKDKIPEELFKETNSQRINIRKLEDV